MFQVADELAFEKYHFLELESVFKLNGNSWRCETKCGNYLHVRASYGIIHMALSETEIGLMDENIVLNIRDKKLAGSLFDFDINKKEILNNLEIIRFNKIKDFMGWTCEEEQMWDS